MLKGFKKHTILFSIFLLLCLAYSGPVQSLVTLPTEQRIVVGDELNIGIQFPRILLEKLSFHIEDNKGILKQDLQNKQTIKISKKIPAALEPGQFDLQLKIFGVIPLKKISVDVYPNIKIIPGGQAVGVVLRTDGVLVVGYSPIITQNGEEFNPAKEAGIEIGDAIIKINDKKVISDEQVAKAISGFNGEEERLIFTIKRNNKLLRKEIKPFYCLETKKFRVGLFVRDNAGGVGTLTFYDTESMKYGALGHVISDNETNNKLNITDGKIVRASIEGIQKGKKGDPGEKIGIFTENTGIGSIDINSECGIFGTISDLEKFENNFSQPLPIAFANQIQTGYAEILTVVEGQEVEKFTVNIEKVFTARKDGKGMILKITDPRLLETTGGIIQGMSGSPIIQKGKIVGAITHVFINDPTKGYGIFIEDMLYEANLLNNPLKISEHNLPRFLLF